MASINQSLCIRKIREIRTPACKPVVPSFGQFSPRCVQVCVQDWVLPNDSTPGRDQSYESGMSSRPRKPSNVKPPAALRSWRVSLIRNHGQVLGFVDAPDRASAEAAAVKAFNLNYDQRSRLVVQERGARERRYRRDTEGTYSAVGLTSSSKRA